MLVGRAVDPAHCQSQVCIVLPIEFAELLQVIAGAGNRIFPLYCYLGVHAARETVSKPDPRRCFGSLEVGRTRGGGAVGRKDSPMLRLVKLYGPGRCSVVQSASISQVPTEEIPIFGGTLYAWAILMPHLSPLEVLWNRPIDDGDRSFGVVVGTNSCGVLPGGGDC